MMTMMTAVIDRTVGTNETDDTTTIEKTTIDEMTTERTTDLPSVLGQTTIDIMMTAQMGIGDVGNVKSHERDASGMITIGEITIKIPNEREMITIETTTTERIDARTDTDTIMIDRTMTGKMTIGKMMTE